MDKSTDDFGIASDNWEKLTDIRSLKAHLENLRLWYQADQNPDIIVIESINASISTLESLYSHLIDLQIKLITVL